MSLKVSVQGLEKIHEARIRKHWRRQDIRWYQAAIVSLSVLKRFLAGEEVDEDSFIRICQAVGIEKWEELAEVSDATSSKKKNSRKSDRLSLSTKSDRIDRTALCCLPKQRLPP